MVFILGDRKYPPVPFEYKRGSDGYLALEIFGKQFHNIFLNWNSEFFENVQNPTFLLLYYSASKKATAMVLIWRDRGYPAVRFEYKAASEQYLVVDL